MEIHNMRDLHNNITLTTAIAPQSTSADTAIVSTIIDRSGYDALEIGIQVGSIGDADVTFAILVEDGDASNLSDNAAVVDAQLLGTEAAAAFKFDSDNTTRKIGYTGSKRYVRVTITPTVGHHQPHF
jgi:hypothetical protein